MKQFAFVMVALLVSVAVKAATIEEVIESNLGTHIGKQDKDERSCRFDVKELADHSFLMTMTLQNPRRGRSVRYPGGAKNFKLDASAGILTFDKSSAGRPNLIYRFDPITLDMIVVEEQGLDICRF
jgi:hypothetical protein